MHISNPLAPSDTLKLVQSMIVPRFASLAQPRVLNAGGMPLSSLRLFALSLSSILFTLAAVTSCPGHRLAGPQATAPTLQLETVVVKKTDSPGQIELPGTVVSLASVPLATKLMAEIKQLRLEVGQHVSKGQVLAVLDDREILAMRSEAAAFRAEAQAALGEVKGVQQQAASAVAQANAALSQSEVALADSRRELARSRVLFEENVIARAQLDKSQLAVDLAEQNVEQAKASLGQAKAAVAQAQSRAPQVEARKQQANAKDMQAAALQEYAVLRAPFEGIVTQKYFEQGQLSVPGQPILVIEQLSAQRISAFVPDTIVSQLKVGSPVPFEYEAAGESRQAKGIVAVIGASADPASRTFPVEITVADTRGLFNGQFVRLLFNAGGPRTRILVPASSVSLDGEQSYVWRISNAGVAARVPVDVGRISEGQIEILRGISEGDSIVLSPPDDLFDGALIQRDIK